MVASFVFVFLALITIAGSWIFLFLTIIVVMFYLVFEVSNMLPNTKYKLSMIDFDIATGQISMVTLVLTILMILLSLGLLFSGNSAYGGIFYSFINLLVHLFWKNVHDRIK